MQKQFYKEPETYFTEEVMQQLDAAAKEDFLLWNELRPQFSETLIYNEEYSRKVIPFIEPTYFEQRTEKVIFEEITQFIVKYGSCNHNRSTKY